MSRASANAVLRAAAKVLVWDLYAAAGYCRTRSFIDIEHFDRALRSALREWKATHANLTEKRRKHGNTEKQ